MSSATLPNGDSSPMIDDADPGSPWMGQSVTLATSGKSDFLWFFDFGFTLDAGDLVQGVEVEITRRQDNGMGGNIRDSKILLTLPNGMDPIQQSPDNKADTGLNWPTSNTAKAYGGASDVWGYSGINFSEVNHADFGILIKVQETGAGMSSDAIVDSATITVHYSPAADLFADLIAAMLSSIGSSTTAAQQGSGQVSFRSQSKTVRVTPYRH